MVAHARRLAPHLDFRPAIDAAVLRAVADATAASPPKLAAAMRYAVSPGGGRLRPELTKLVAAAHHDPDPSASTAAAVAVELVHCASLVHDDLPCFDDAETRRGKPALHRAFGEPLAVLTGDALIVLAFETLASASPAVAPALVAALARGIGASRGIIAGQAWESEPAVPLDDYHRAKTGALFGAAAAMGAIAAGAEPDRWYELGERLGSAYQASDDVIDAASDAASAGKTTGRDAELGRPSVVRAHGLEAARARVDALVAEAIALIPAAPGAEIVRGWIVSKLV